MKKNRITVQRQLEKDKFFITCAISRYFDTEDVRLHVVHLDNIFNAQTQENIMNRILKHKEIYRMRRCSW